MSYRTGFWALRKGIETFAPEILRQAIALGLTTREGDQRRGGYFCLLRYNDHQGEWASMNFKCGSVPQGSRARAFCNEKARRVLELGATSSWMSRDPEKNQWGGAVRVHQDVIFSFDGLPEDTNEALVLVLAVELELLNLEEAQGIAKLSANEKFSQLLKAFKAAT